jgi:tRNA(Met) C34 N-acetyltransferase TmcA
MMIGLGLAIAGAVGFGYSNIFVTSPSPENLKTLFEFITKGFDAMNYQVCYLKNPHMIVFLGTHGL